MPGGNKQIDLPAGHEVIFQDDEMIISLWVDDAAAFDEDMALPKDAEDLADYVYFWYYEFEDDEDLPLRWEAYEDKEIVLEESDQPGESVAVLSVVSAMLEPQRVLIGAKAASILAKRVNRPLRAIKGPRLSENQELIYDADGCVAILDSRMLAAGSETLQTVFVHCEQWGTPYQAIWQHELRESIETHMFPEGQLGLIPVIESGNSVARAIPMEFAEVLAQRFGKRIEPPTRPNDGVPAPDSGHDKPGGCASVLCLMAAIIAVVAVMASP